MISTAATIFSLLTAIVMIFQLGLALGLPWGKASMGGKYPGKYPPKMRVVALFTILILAFLNALVLAEAQLLFSSLQNVSKFAIWPIAVFFLISTVLNSITPSKIERLWAPVALIQAICCFIIAID